LTSPPTLKIEPGAGQQDRADRHVVGKVVPDRAQLADQALVDRVARVGAVQGDGRDLVGDLDLQVVVVCVAGHGCAFERGGGNG
jgi:hypothetical protein